MTQNYYDESQRQRLISLVDEFYATALALHLKLLRLWNAMMPHDNLPAASKYAQSVQGCDAGVARQPMAMPGADQQARIRAALEELGLTGR